jgi:hypothetical protein
MASSKSKHVDMLSETVDIIKLCQTKIILLLIFEEIFSVPFEIPLKMAATPHGHLKNMVNRFCLKMYETRLRIGRRK